MHRRQNPSESTDSHNHFLRLGDRLHFCRRICCNQIDYCVSSVRADCSFEYRVRLLACQIHGLLNQRKLRTLAGRPAICECQAHGHIVTPPIQRLLHWSEKGAMLDRYTSFCTERLLQKNRSRNEGTTNDLHTFSSITEFRNP
jgi:hypothetical protein